VAQKRYPGAGSKDGEQFAQRVVAAGFQAVA
jgi:hypothetical protein